MIIIAGYVYSCFYLILSHTFIPLHNMKERQIIDQGRILWVDTSVQTVLGEK